MTDDDVLRTFLGKLPQEDLISLFLATLKIVTGNNPEVLKSITHEVVTLVHVRELMDGKTTLKGVSEEHREECFVRAIKFYSKTYFKREINDKTARMLYEDFKKYKGTFPDWALTLHER